MLGVLTPMLLVHAGILFAIGVVGLRIASRRFTELLLR
jgi:hypothetical protein